MEQDTLNNGTSYYPPCPGCRPSCPCCGRPYDKCPECGRPFPDYPYYPSYPEWPAWTWTTPTCDPPLSWC